MRRMRTTFFFLFLLCASCLAGCRSPVAACEAAQERYNAWQCEVCPITNWCPGGHPHEIDRSRCEGAVDDAPVRNIDCKITCYEELIAGGTNICPPQPSPPPWNDEFLACMEDCEGL